MRRLLFLAVLVAAGMAAPTCWATTVYLHADSMSVSQAQLEAALPAFQTAVSRDLAPIWGVDATLTTDPSVPADMTLTVNDTPDCFGCLGYHTVRGNQPQAFVFATLADVYHDDWRLVATHELFEMLVGAPGISGSWSPTSFVVRGRSTWRVPRAIQQNVGRSSRARRRAFPRSSRARSVCRT